MKHCGAEYVRKLVELYKLQIMQHLEELVHTYEDFTKIPHAQYEFVQIGSSFTTEELRELARIIQANRYRS